MSKKPKKIIKSSVRDSIKKLISEATKAYKAGNETRSKRYVKMAMDLVKKHKTRLPAELRNSFCRKCHLIWLPARTVTVTFDKKHSCLRVKCRCGHSKRL
ncbi:TPA: hypothetical protein EYP38_00585 [Candidatus Micrarchaeota archaeon]|nr:hypothetical protein [Candidatus Micrarchaeota archaeon]